MRINGERSKARERREGREEDVGTDIRRVDRQK